MGLSIASSLSVIVIFHFHWCIDDPAVFCAVALRAEVASDFGVRQTVRMGGRPGGVADLSLFSFRLSEMMLDGTGQLGNRPPIVTSIGSSFGAGTVWAYQSPLATVRKLETMMNDQLFMIKYG